MLVEVVERQLDVRLQVADVGRGRREAARISRRVADVGRGRRQAARCYVAV